MQMTMTLDACPAAGSPSLPASPPCRPPVDLDMNGRAVSSPVKTYHLSGRCYDEAKAEHAARGEALKAA